MRRLLVKLVAIETALVGWLAYWLFLVYANNPGIADQLAGNLLRFPQLSFSTIDITILAIIAGLAIALAFKFQRALRPGIRLERALQMLENLMKRNLVLEAQVAELKIEKIHVGPTPLPPQPSLAATEPRPGSWEKAFRTPLEAGPSMTVRSSSANDTDASFGREPSFAPPRIELKQPIPVPMASPTIMSSRPPTMIASKPEDRTVTPSSTGVDKPFNKPSASDPAASPIASSWEDSPKYLGESKGILNPSSPPRRIPVVSESGGLRQPYIPSPAPKKVPASVIVGPMSSIPSPQAKPTSKSTTQVQASPKSSVLASSTRPPQAFSKPQAIAATPKTPGTDELSVTSTTGVRATKPSDPPPTPSSTPSPLKSSIQEKASEAAESDSRDSDTEKTKTDVRNDVKSFRPIKKKFSYDEE